MKVVKLLERIIGFTFLAGILIVALYAIYPAIVEAQLEMGMNKDAVLSIVGKEPLWEQTRLELCNNQEWGGNCDEASESKADVFLVWKLGIDVYLVVGISKDSGLVFKGIGDT